jgi:hypothetical protein
MHRRAVLPGGWLALLCSAVMICRINGVVRGKGRFECDKCPVVCVSCQQLRVGPAGEPTWPDFVGRFSRVGAALPPRLESAATHGRSVHEMNQCVD